MTLQLGYSGKAGQVRDYLRALADKQNPRLQDSVFQTRAEESKGASRLSTPLLEAGHLALDPVRVAATERIQKFIQRVTLEPDDFNVERLPSQNKNLGYVTRRPSLGPALGHQRQNAVCEQGNKLVALVEQSVLLRAKTLSEGFALCRMRDVHCNSHTIFNERVLRRTRARERLDETRHVVLAARHEELFSHALINGSAMALNLNNLNSAAAHAANACTVGDARAACATEVDHKTSQRASAQRSREHVKHAEREMEEAKEILRVSKTLTFPHLTHFIEQAHHHR
jgi:hypothetical protein